MTYITLKNVQLLFPAIYNPSVTPFSRDLFKTCFIISVGTNEFEALKDAGIHPKTKDGRTYFSTISKFPPLVTASTTGLAYLQAAFEICDVRNIKPDCLFKDLIVDIDVNLFEYNHDDEMGKAMSLNEIIMSDDACCKMLSAARNFKLKG